MFTSQYGTRLLLSTVNVYCPVYLYTWYLHGHVKCGVSVVLCVCVVLYYRRGLLSTPCRVKVGHATAAPNTVCLELCISSFEAD